MNDQKLCTVCNQQKEIRTVRTDAHLFIIKCSRCGTYEISETSYASLPSRIREAEKKYPDARYVLSYWIRNRFDIENIPVDFGIENIMPILTSITLPHIKEQCNNLILYLGENIFPYSEFKQAPLATFEATIGSANEKDLLYIQKHLYNQGYLTIPGHDEEKLSVTKAADRIGLTFEGWNRYNELKKIDKDSTYAFMAMEYKDEELNEICESHFKPAVAQTGYELRLLRDHTKAGIIDNQLRIAIRRCKFLLSDLTHNNNGAYWESGYAEGLGKPVIYLCEKEKFEKDKTHFDTNHCTTIIWDKKNIDESLENLKATIRTTFSSDAKMQD